MVHLTENYFRALETQRLGQEVGVGWVENKQIRRITPLLSAASRPTMQESYTTGKAWENDTEGSVLVSFYCQLHTTDSSGKKESPLRGCVNQAGLWPCLRATVSTDAGCGRAQPTLGRVTLSRWSRVA